MPNFDLSGIALSMVCPTNKLITDDKGLPGAYVYRPKKMLSELISGGSASIVHPAFMVCDVQQEGIYFGKYQGMIHNNRIYSPRPTLTSIPLRPTATTKAGATTALRQRSGATWRCWLKNLGSQMAPCGRAAQCGERHYQGAEREP